MPSLIPLYFIALEHVNVLRWTFLGVSGRSPEVIAKGAKRRSGQNPGSIERSDIHPASCPEHFQLFFTRCAAELTHICDEPDELPRLTRHTPADEHTQIHMEIAALFKFLGHESPIQPQDNLTASVDDLQ